MLTEVRSEMKRRWQETITRLADGDLSVSPLDLPLNARASNLFYALRGEIGTIGELLECSDERLLSYPNFGRKSLKEVDAALALAGLSREGRPRIFGTMTEVVTDASKELLQVYRAIENLQLAVSALAEALDCSAPARKERTDA